MLVDDHAVVRTGFRLLLQATDDLRVVAEAGSGEEAIERYAGTLPDVVVMDVSMAGIGGIEAIRRILGHHPQARILALSAHADTSHPRRVLDAGALGYLSKRSAPEEMVEAVRTVAAGRGYIDASLAQMMALPGKTGRRNPTETLSPPRVRCIPQACSRRFGQLHRRSNALEPKHRGDTSVQHQTETVRIQSGRTRADRGCVSDLSKRRVRATGMAPGGGRSLALVRTGAP